jgi:hypothetical protein
MILSSDELEILDYLKSWNGKFVTMVEICRCAGGRRKFREDANWARPLMARLVDSKLTEVNERGHYRVILEEKPAHKPVKKKASVGVLGEDYFPQPQTAALIGEDYFPTTPEAEPAPQEVEAVPERWFSPHVAKILKQSGKKFGGHKGG